MHDIRAIRENPAAFDTGLQKRGLGPQSAGLLQLDAAHRTKVTEAQALQTRRNEASKEIGKAKAARDEDKAQALMAEVAGIKDRMTDLEANVASGIEVNQDPMESVLDAPAQPRGLGNFPSVDQNAEE